MKFFILVLLIALGCDTALAQTKVPANVLDRSPWFVDSSPRPTFYFSLAPAYRGFASLLLTWGTGSTKDGILVKNNLFSYKVTDINKINDVVTADSQNDIYAFNYYNSTGTSPGRLSFVRSWDTGDSKQDVPLKRNEPNSFQWEVYDDVSKTLYVGSCSCTFIQVQALLEKQGQDGPVGYLGIEKGRSIWTARIVLPPKSQIEKFAENFQFLKLF